MTSYSPRDVLNFVASYLFSPHNVLASTLDHKVSTSQESAELTASSSLLNPGLGSDHLMSVSPGYGRLPPLATRLKKTLVEF